MAKLDLFSYGCDHQHGAMSPPCSQVPSGEEQEEIDGCFCRLFRFNLILCFQNSGLITPPPPPAPSCLEFPVTFHWVGKDGFLNCLLEIPFAKGSLFLGECLIFIYQVLILHIEISLLYKTYLSASLALH